VRLCRLAERLWHQYWEPLHAARPERPLCRQLLPRLLLRGGQLLALRRIAVLQPPLSVFDAALLDFPELCAECRLDLSPLRVQLLFVTQVLQDVQPLCYLSDCADRCPTAVRRRRIGRLLMKLRFSTLSKLPILHLRAS